MNLNLIGQEARKFYTEIIGLDQGKSKQAILDIYDEDCTLTNPFVVLRGRDEIIKSYAALATNNLEISIEIEAVTFDKDSQTCMLDIKQFLMPKALGGVISINLSYILKLQLEEQENLYKVVDHLEIHSAQNLISQMPIIGGLYDNSLRNAFGQMSIAGTSLLNHTGVLDLVPAAVEKTKQTASAVRKGVGSLATGASGVAANAIEKAGVKSFLNYAAGMVKGTASALLEEGRGDQISCYSVSCKPGYSCYSPTCARSRAYQLLSRESISEIVKGLYSVGKKSQYL